jgi:very-short-patch-repair endonuclease
LRDHRLAGWKFRRQVPIGPSIVDFFCAGAKLAVELDGDSHDGRIDSDRAREAELMRRGVRVVRFTNDEALYQRDDIVQTLLGCSRDSHPRLHTALPREWERRAVN